jgi:hypothetical protein
MSQAPTQVPQEDIAALQQVIATATSLLERITNTQQTLPPKDRQLVQS